MAVQNRAAVIPAAGQPLELTTSDAPKPGFSEVLIRNHTVAIQPLDAKILLSGYGGAGALKSYPAVLGSSGAGVIEELGEAVDGVSVGDRVVFDTRAYVNGDVNLREGTWQKYVVCNASTVAKIGDLPFEQAVLIDFPLQTAVAALHHFLGMAKPGAGRLEEKVLIWGAGGAVGTYAVQFARSVGHNVVVTASPRDLDRQKALGAASVVDYKADDAVDQLRKLGPFKYLFTASGDPTSQQALASLLQPEGGKFGSVLGGEVQLPPNVERVYLPFSQAAQLEEHVGWRDYWYGEYLPKVLQGNIIEPVKFTKREGGLAALQQASSDVFEGKIRGKLIVNVQE